MDDTSTILARFITEQTAADATVRDLERIPGGFSYETWSLRACWQERASRQDARLILRKAPRGGVLEPYDASKEFRILQALQDTDVPVPRALWVEPTGSVLGTSFYLMEMVEGTVPLPWDRSIHADTRAEMQRQFADILGALHTLDWEARGLGFLGVPADRGDPAALELDRCDEVLARIALRPYPILHEIIAALRARRPRAPRLALIHDDYRMGNFVWRDGRIVALLDWERAFIGDPMADVAFSRIEGLAGWCSISGAAAQRYSARSGIPIDESRVAFYTILEQLKATLVGLTGLKAFADGRTSDLRLVQIGRVAHQGIPGLAQAVRLGNLPPLEKGD
jgi:aminoglycoside phosphotransferase (APT) family kinase protein